MYIAIVLQMKYKRLCPNVQSILSLSGRHLGRLSLAQFNMASCLMWCLTWCVTDVSAWHPDDCLSVPRHCTPILRRERFILTISPIFQLTRVYLRCISFAPVGHLRTFCKLDFKATRSWREKKSGCSLAYWIFRFIMEPSSRRTHRAPALKGIAFQDKRCPTLARSQSVTELHDPSNWSIEVLHSVELYTCATRQHRPRSFYGISVWLPFYIFCEGCCMCWWAKLSFCPVRTLPCLG